jgi:hypothetical protein
VKPQQGQVAEPRLTICERCADDGAMCRTNTVALGM